MENEALKISGWQKKKLLSMQTDRPFTFPECNVQIIRENLELTQSKNTSRLPSITLPLHCFHLTEMVAGEEQMQYFSQTTGGTTCQWSGEVAEDLQGLLSVCCYVVPLRDLDLVTTFNAASFCVAFFFFTVHGKANSSC